MRKFILISISAWIFAGLALAPAPLPAQNEPKFAALKSTFQKEYLRIGMLVQWVADFQPERSFPGENGYSIANMRLNIGGTLDAGFSYFFQTNFIGGRSILDARLSYALSRALTVDLGQFKSPFSAEFLINAANIDFINRAQAVTALAPGRQVGLQLRGKTNDSRLTYMVGMFNGNGIAPSGNNDDNFLLGGRVTLYPAIQKRSDTDMLEIGANLAYSDEDGGPFLGRRTYMGADFRFVQESLLLSGEILRGVFDFAGLTPVLVKPWGLHLTTGYSVSPKTQVLVRLDHFDPGTDADSSTLIVLGLNHWPTGPTEVQVNFILPTAQGLENAQLLVNGQISF